MNLEFIETNAFSDLGGLPIVLCDTAGIRSDTDNLIELEGISRAKDSVK